MPFPAQPQTLIEERVEAFRRGDFAFIYDSYHLQAPFLEQYPDRDDYLDYARREIAPSCSILKCKILHQVVTGDEARVIFQQLVKTSSGMQESFEMAHLVFESGNWAYLGSERIERGDFIGRPEELRPRDFQSVPNRVFF